MKRLLVAIGCAAMTVTLVPAAQAQTQSGENRYPRTDVESRSVRTNLPTPVRISNRSLRGDVIARGRRVQRNNNGRQTNDCEFDFGVEVSIYSGSRETEFTMQPNCTVVLTDLIDNDVVEPEQRIVQAQMPGVFGRVRNIAGRLWEAIFPTAFAQSYVLRRLYHAIWTCGIACAGGIDGLTAQQGWIDYRYNNVNAQLDAAWGWFCTAGMWNGQSNCQPPMEVPGAPMNQINTGWSGYNPWIMYRVWSGTQISAGEQTTFKWTPGGTSPQFNHTLYNERKATSWGVPTCISYYSGLIVNGPVRSLCNPVAR